MFNCSQPSHHCYQPKAFSVLGTAQWYLRYQGIDDINDTVHCPLPHHSVPTLPQPREIGIGGNGFQIIYKNPVKPHCTLSLLLILGNQGLLYCKCAGDIEEIANSFYNFHNFHRQQQMTFRKLAVILSWENTHSLLHFILLLCNNEVEFLFQFPILLIFIFELIRWPLIGNRRQYS